MKKRFEMRNYSLFPRI